MMSVKFILFKLSITNRLTASFLSFQDSFSDSQKEGLQIALISCSKLTTLDCLPWKNDRFFEIVSSFWLKSNQTDERRLNSFAVADEIESGSFETADMAVLSDDISVRMSWKVICESLEDLTVFVSVNSSSTFWWVENWVFKIFFRMILFNFLHITVWLIREIFFQKQ